MKDAMKVGIVAVVAVLFVALIAIGVNYHTTQEALSLVGNQPPMSGGYVDPGTGDVQQTSGGDIIVEANTPLTPTLYINGTDESTSGTEISSMKLMYRLDGSSVWRDGTGGTAISLVGVGQTVEVYGGLNAADDDAEDYADHAFFTIPPEGGTVVKELPGWQDDVVGDIIAHYKWEDASIDTALTGSAADTTYPIEISFRPASDEAMGDPFVLGAQVVHVPRDSLVDDKNVGGMVTFKVPSANVSDVTVTAITYKGDDYPIVACNIPNGKAATYSATNYVGYMFALPGAVDGNKITINAEIKADSTNAINTSAHAITVYYADVHNYFDNNLNTIKYGIEDEVRVEVGIASDDTVAPLLTPS